MERLFKIEAFRNMGFKDGKPEATELLLNESAAKGHLGNLLTVVGANGAGKSNVLSAMNIFASGEFKETDITNLFYMNDCRIPQLTMSVKDGDDKYSCLKDGTKQIEISYPNMPKDSELQDEHNKWLFADLEALCILEDKHLTKEDRYSYGRTEYIAKNFHDLQRQVDTSVKKALENADEEAKKKLEEAKAMFKKSFERSASNFVSAARKTETKILRGKINSDGWYEKKIGEYSDDEQDKLYADCVKTFEAEKEQAYREYMKQCNALVKLSDEEYSYYTNQIGAILSRYESMQDSYETTYDGNRKSAFEAFFKAAYYSEYGSSGIYYRYKEPRGNKLKALKIAFKKKYGYNGFGGRIIVYQQEHITSEMLNSDIKNIINNSFYIALFNAMGISLEQVENAYRLYNQTKTRAFLSDFQKECEEKIKTVAEKFNKLFMISNTPFEFSIEFERGGGIFFTIYRKEKPQVLDLQSTGFRYFFDLFFNLLNTTTLESGDIIIMDEPALNLHVKGQRELHEFLKEFAIRNDILIIIATHSPFLIDIDNLDDIRVVASDGAVSRIENNFAAVDPTDPDSLLPIKEALTVENHVLVNPKETVVFVQTMEEYCYLVAFKKLFEIKGISFLPVNFVSADKVQCEIALKRIREIRDDAFILVHDDDIGHAIKELCKDSEFTVFTLSNIDESFTTVANLFADGEQIEGASTFKNFIHHEQNKVGENTKANFRKVFDWFENC